jgi:F-type H+-transporting ATPase subunit b
MAEHASEVVKSAAEVAEHAAEKVGMPQIDFSSFPNQIFWLLITLVVIYLILTRISLPRIGAVLAERQGTITNDIAAAEDLKQKAVEAEEVYNQALADARAEAGRIVAAARADIKADLDVATAKADAEISARAAESEVAIAEIRAKAMDSIVEVSWDAAKEIVTVFGGKADVDTITSAVAARLKGL